MENTEKEKLNVKTAISKCPKLPTDKEFEELFQTKRENKLPKNINLSDLNK